MPSQIRADGMSILSNHLHLVGGWVSARVDKDCPTRAVIEFGIQCDIRHTK